jgi:riboflavin kinase/FMN adenylyltransferase
VRVLRGVDALVKPGTGTALTIGTFDGVHEGHRALVRRTRELASELGAESAAVTWDRHPAETLRPDKAPPLITSTGRKIDLLGETGLDVTAVLEFDRELSSWPPERFVEQILAEGLGARAIVVGEGWRFGRGAAGDTELLAKVGEKMGFTVEAATLETMGDEPVSSSRIRRLVAAGEVEEARELLGRPFDIDAEVVHGDDRGKSLGFPTANLSTFARYLQPAQGVYACRARVGDEWCKAATNVGVNPTFGGHHSYSPVRIEAHLIDFTGDIYGRTLRLEFHKRLRDEERYERVDDLIAQIAKDVEATRALVD